MTEIAPPHLKPNDLVAGFVLLILCQLVGEALVTSAESSSRAFSDDAIA